MRLSGTAARLAAAAAALGAILPLVAADRSEAATNLVRNPGCETDASSWVGYHATLTRTTASPHSGSASCQVASGGSGGYYTLDDSPSTVSNPQQGAVYVATAWARTSTAAGKAVQLILRQSGGTQATRESASPTVTLGSSWAQLSVQVTIDGGGRTALEVYLVQSSAVAGNSFQADDVSLTLQSSGTSSGGTASTWNQQTYSGALFSSTSAWNAKASGAVDPNSSTMLTHLTLSSTPFDVMMTTSGIPLWYADSAIPKVWVSPSTSWWGGVSAPIPSVAKADTGSDHHLIAWDVPNHTLYEFWDAVKSSSGAWSAGYGITFDSGGIGYQTGIWQGSARESGVSLVGGLIRYGEMKDGVIPHALAMSYPYTRGDGYARGLGSGGVMGIASQNNTGTLAKGYIGWSYLPEGARFRLKASVNVASRCGTNRACQVIGTALQQYGAYVVDTGGWPCFYAEILDGKQVSWSGLLSATDTHAWQTADFEVLTLPTLTLAPKATAAAAAAESLAARRGARLRQRLGDAAREGLAPR